MLETATCDLCAERPQSRLRRWFAGVALYVQLLYGIPYEWDTCPKCRSRRNLRVAGRDKTILNQ